MRASGYPHQIFADNFRIDARDVDWLPSVGSRGWILVTKDWRIQERPSERAAITNAKVRAFIFRERRLKGEVMAEIIQLAMPQMLRAIDRYRAPFIFALETDGTTTPLSTLEDI